MAGPSTLSPDEIDALALRAQRGDRQAFRALVLELQGDLRVYLSAFDVAAGLAEEVLQATFVTAYHKIHLYTPQGAFRAWLKTIARNHLLKELREQRRHALVRGDDVLGALATSALEDLEREGEIEAHTHRLRQCIERLPRPSRELVEGRYLQQLSTAVLASQCRRTEVWVRVTLCRIRKSLRQCMEAGAAS